MKHRFLRTLQLRLAVLDVLMINIVFFALQFLFLKYMHKRPNAEYMYFIFFLNGVWIAIASLKNIYNERYIGSFEQFTKVMLKAYVYLLLAVIIFLFFFRLMLISRLFLIIALSSIPLALLANRLIYFFTYQYVKKSAKKENRILVIGYNNLSKKLASYLSEDGINEIVGFCEEYPNVHELSRYPILSEVSETLDVCKRYGVNEIYSTLAPENNPGLYKLIQAAEDNCIRFRIVPDLGVFIKRQMYIDYLKEIPIISLRREPMEDWGNRILKRLFDIVVSLFAVVFILSWLIPLVSLLIFLESRGPIFFIQQRSGKNNRTFPCIKFRSMIQNKNANIQQAARNDSRITKIGKFLRRTSLDEFPQFLNVLKGDMSIAGPRPHMLKHTDEYSKLIGQYMLRQFVKPGITGWAQVNGFRGETKNVFQMQKRVEHDLWYLENWNLLLDIKIVFMTLFNVIKGEKNAF
ncbi:MAG: undecaprenyl-phosphate glucose phosphotransferase [Bacteroidetes bacterium]|jgi:putative colanic acid biosynthesis UDP-glucose lipid carrier transferase|nr:MAG: undecaprenyl-phosphate glucose phosphotransferase [Bacteroidota bacterium]